VTQTDPQANASNLTAEELTSLIHRVFEPRAGEGLLAVMVDLPDQALEDNDDWRQRRAIAADWVKRLSSQQQAHGLDAHLFVYRNVRTNNADLPDTVWPVDPDELPADADEAAKRQGMPISEMLGTHTLVLAPTELSATAPLKVLARTLGFRAATMPGFAPAMIPALRLDYGEVNRRVMVLKELLDAAVAAELDLVVDGATSHRLSLDLRHRTAHASGGLLREAGTAGNLPSGEAYIVPYEGEHEGDPTTSQGELPVQHSDEVVLYRIEGNVAVEVLSDGVESRREAQRLAAEPAYGNLAELGLGVLADLGIEPIGEVLLDEKLGLHIAFGRSEHFGGQVGPDRFSSPSAVVHQDYVYIKQIQPRVVAARVDLELADGRTVELIRDGDYATRL
jgi:leucyl aminopeptidase (aminopeptidase T)